jgi:hypothetical protein
MQVQETHELGNNKRVMLRTKAQQHHMHNTCVIKTQQMHMHSRKEQGKRVKNWKVIHYPSKHKHIKNTCVTKVQHEEKCFRKGPCLIKNKAPRRRTSPTHKQCDQTVQRTPPHAHTNDLVLGASIKGDVFSTHKSSKDNHEQPPWKFHKS